MKKIFDKRWPQSIFFFVLACIFGFCCPAMAQSPEELYREAVALISAGNPSLEDKEEALRKIKAAAEQKPGEFKYAYNTGYINALLTRWASAEEWFRAALDLTTEDADRADTEVWLKFCKEKRFQKEFEEGRETEHESRMLLAYSLKSEGFVNDTHRDRLRTGHRRLPTVLAGSHDDAALRAFFEDGFPGLHTIRQDEFLIVGFGDKLELGDHYRRGIKDFYKILRSRFFTGGPQQVITVLVDEQAHRLVGIVNKIYPDSPIDIYAPYLGLYNSTDNLIIATVGGGYGTLLHELMHAMVANDYPNCPGWLEEAMATMFERSKWTPTRLVPLPNWRMHFVNKEEIPDLAGFDDMLRSETKDKKTLAMLRLLMLFLDSHDKVADLYNAQKRQGADFRISQTLAAFGPEFSNAEWQRFAHGMVDGYLAELSRDQGKPTYGETLFVQRALNRIIDAGLVEDGIWGSSTETKVREFQARFGLGVDGNVGRNTRAALQREFAKSRF